MARLIRATILIELKSMCKGVCFLYMKANLSKMAYDCIRPTGSRHQRMYRLSKVNKEGFPLRPILHWWLLFNMKWLSLWLYYYSLFYICILLFVFQTRSSSLMQLDNLNRVSLIKFWCPLTLSVCLLMFLFRILYLYGCPL